MQATCLLSVLSICLHALSLPRIEISTTSILGRTISDGKTRLHSALIISVGQFALYLSALLHACLYIYQPYCTPVYNYLVYYACLFSFVEYLILVAHASSQVILYLSSVATYFQRFVLLCCEIMFNIFTLLH